MLNRYNNSSHPRNILLFFLLFFFITKGYAQVLIPYLDADKYGYSDMAGNVLIRPEYEDATFFDEHGLASVRKADKWGLINNKDEQILPFEADRSIELLPVRSVSYSQGIQTIDTLKDLMEYEVGPKQFRFINIKNHQATEVLEIDDNLSSIPSGYTRRNPPLFSLGWFVGKTRNGAYQIIDRQGTTIKTCKEKPQILGVDIFSYEADGKKFIYDRKTKVEIAIPFRKIRQLVDGRFLVVSNRNTPIEYSLSPASGKYGLVDLKGQVFIDTIYSGIDWHGRNHLIAKYDSFYLFLNYNGSRVNSQNYKRIYPLNSDYYQAQLENGDWIILDKLGMAAKKRSYDQIRFLQHEKYYTWNSGDTSGILDSALVDVIDYESESILHFQNSNLFTIQINNKWGVIDRDKKILIPPVYDMCYLDSYDYLKLKQNGKYGLAAIDGRILLEPIYEDIQIVETSGQLYFRPKKEGYYACFDEKLNRLSDFISHRAYLSDRPVDWYHKNDRYHFTTRFGQPIGFPAKSFTTGNVLTDTTFIAVLYDSSSSYALLPSGKFIGHAPGIEKLGIERYNIPAGLFALRKDSLQGVLNHKNEIIIPFKKQKVFRITDQLIFTREADLFFIYNHSGTKIYKDGFDFIDDSGLSIVGKNIPNSAYKYLPDTCLYGRSDSLIEYRRNYGYINAWGEIVVPLQYNNTFRYFEKYAFASTGFENGHKKSYLLDTLGNVVLETNYDFLYPVNHTDYSNYYIADYLDRDGVIDINGKIIIPFEYRRIDGFIDSSLFVALDTNNRWNLINRLNKKIYSDMNLYNGPGEHFLSLPNDRFVVYPGSEAEIIDAAGNKFNRIKSQQVRTRYFYGVLTNYSHRKVVLKTRTPQHA